MAILVRQTGDNIIFILSFPVNAHLRPINGRLYGIGNGIGIQAQERCLFLVNPNPDFGLSFHKIVLQIHKARNILDLF